MWYFLLKQDVEKELEQEREIEIGIGPGPPSELAKRTPVSCASDNYTFLIPLIMLYIHVK